MVLKQYERPHPPMATSPRLFIHALWLAGISGNTLCIRFICRCTKANHAAE